MTGTEVIGAPEPVVLTGLGIISPLGCSLGELTDRFASGERASPSEALGGQGVQVLHWPVGAIPEAQRSRVGRLDRLCRMFLAASYLAVDHAGLTLPGDAPERVGLSFGTGLGCLLTNEEYYRKVLDAGPGGASPHLFAYTVSSAAAGEVSIALGIRGPNTTAHMGLAAGIGAIGYGFDLIQMAKADVVLAGGADVIGPALLEGLAEMGLLKSGAAALPFRSDVAGVFPSEGAVVAVLETRGHACARGAAPLATIRGYAAGFEPSLTRSERNPAGISATIRRALELSGQPESAVDLLITSAHGTPTDATELGGLRQVFTEGRPRTLLAPKASLGEAFSASGPFGLALAVGLLQGRPPLADGVALGLDGRTLSPDQSRRSLSEASLAVVHSLCYSGNTIGLVLQLP